MNAPDVRTADPQEIQQYIKHLLADDSPEGSRDLVEYLRELVEVRPSEFQLYTFQLYIRNLGRIRAIPQETINLLIRASNGEMTLDGVKLKYSNVYQLPDTIAAEAAGGGGRRRRRSTKRRKNSRKSLRRRRSV